MLINKLTLNKNYNRIPNKSIVQARNVRLDDNFEFLQNEEGFDKLYDFPADICGIIATDVELVVFCTNNDGSDYIYIVNDDVSILSLQGNLNFSTEYPIKGEWVRNNKGELIVTFNDTNNDIRVHNITNPYMELDPVTKGFINPADGLNKLKLTPNFKVPIISGIPSPTDSILGMQFGDGGSLEKGVYQFSLSYYISDFDRLNWSLPSLPIYIGLTRSTRMFYNSTYEEDGDAKPSINIMYDDNVQIANETLTNKAISLYISNIDTLFKKYKLALIHRTDTGIKVYDMGDHLTSITTHTIPSVSDLELSLEEVTIPYINYNKANDLTVIDNRLALLGTTSSGFIDYQKYANNIKVRYSKTVENNATYLKVPVLDEVYALNIGLVGKDGFVKGIFHIPGRAPETYNGLAENALLTYQQRIDYNKVNGNNVDEAAKPEYVFQVYNTASNVNTGIGKLGYWENKNETYPNIDSFDIWDVDNDGVGFKIGSIKNSKVRHHKIPDYSKLIQPNNGLIINDIGTSAVYLNFSDIKFPKDILDDIQGFFIAYSNRDSSNSTVYAYHPMFRNNFWKIGATSTDDTSRYFTMTGLPNFTFSNSAIRFNDFNLLTNKPALVNPYLKGVGLTNKLNSNNSLVTDCSTVLSLNSEIRDVTDYKYIPRDNSATDPDNRGREEALLLKVNNLYNDTNNLLLCELKAHINNIYYPFYNRKISIASNVVQVEDGVYNYSINNVNDFDGFISLYHNTMYRGDQTLEIDEDAKPPIITREDGDEDLNSATAINVYKTVNISHVNTYFRSINSEKSEQDYEDDRSWVENFFGKGDSSYTYTTNIGTDPSKPSIFNYNRQYSFTNSIVSYYVYNHNNVFVNVNPYRVARSLVFNKESITLNWRYFSALEYYEMPKHRGIGKSINAVDNMLLIHMEHSLFVAKLKDKLTTLDGDAYIGTADIFDRNPEELLSTKRGSVGIQSRFGSVVSEVGYVFIDTYDKSIYIFSNGQLDTISDDSVRALFTKYMYASTGNPLKYDDVIVGIDNKNDRLIITNHGYNPFTISYCYNGNNKGWISFHDYIPAIIVNNRLGSYSVDREDLTSLYKFNSESSSKFGTYFSTKKESYIDILVNESPNIDKLLNSISFQSGVNDDSNNINKIFVYTRNQCTKVYDITTFNIITDFDKARYFNGYWHYDLLRDYTSNEIPQLIVNDFGIINIFAINENKAWYELGDIADKYFIIRLITNNNNEMRFRDLGYNVSLNRR